MKQNKMAQMPVRKLMLTMGIPMVLSMMLQALYNIVDSAFVSNMAAGGEDALNALTLAFPLQMLMVAISIGTGVGANALLSKSLGQADHKKAAATAGNATFLAIVISLLFILFGLTGVDAYLHTQTSNAVVFDMAAEYLRICCVVSFGIVFFSIYEKLLQAGGHSLYSTIAQISGAVVNIILDPILIYGLLGFPQLGVAGAAYATVAGQIVSFVLALLFHLKVNTGFSHSPRFLRPDTKIIREIYAIGLPAIIAQALMSFMTYGLNIILYGISESMVTAYGLYYKIQQFLLFAAFGLRDAITPIISFAYGMGSRQRIRDGIRYGMLFTLVIMVVGLVAIEAFATPFTAMFGLSGETERLCILAMRIISLSFVFAGANIAFQGIYQALDGGISSLIVSLCRQIIFLFPFIFLFAGFSRQDVGLCWTVWTAFPICEALSCMVAVLLYRHTVKPKIKTLSSIAE